MAFMIGPLEETSVWTKDIERNDILFLLRSDHESLFVQHRGVDKLRKILDQTPHTKNLTFHLVDWWDYGKFLNTSVEEPLGPNNQ